MRTGDIVIAKIISDRKIGFLVVEIEGRFYRVYRRNLPKDRLMMPGEFIQLEVCDGNIAEGESVLLKYFEG